MKTTLFLLGLLLSPAALRSAEWRAAQRPDGDVVLTAEQGELVIGAGVRFALDGREQTLDRPAGHQTRQVSGPLGEGREERFAFENDTHTGARVITLYDGFATIRTEVQARKGATSANRIEAFRATYPGSWNAGARLLRTPFDNDKWGRYRTFRADTVVTGCEVGCLYDDATRFGAVVGSLTHDLWKSAVTFDAPANELLAESGVTSKFTRDVLPHGVVSGRRVESTLFFVTAGGDWRLSLEQYGALNAAVSGRRIWNAAKPVGWNSWGKMKFGITIEKLDQTADFIASELMPTGLESRDGAFWFCFDSGWQRFDDEQLEAFIRRCHARGQKVGAYLAPFGHWGKRHDQPVNKGFGATFEDAALKADGRVQLSVANAVALDPTHPAVQARLDEQIARIRRLGFDFVKADFLTQASLEADSYYDRRITTGMMAYNYAMNYMRRKLGEDIFINQAISPLFPSQYAHSRRIACDAWAKIGQSEYTLNSVTFGWWLGRAYCYNDPDHLVLDGEPEGANRARMTSGIVTGLALLGDDWSDEAEGDMRPRAREILTRREVNALMASEIRFRPANDGGGKTSELFVGQDGDTYYLAVFNYGRQPLDFTFDPARLGLPVRSAYPVRELWSGDDRTLTEGTKLTLAAADAAIYRIKTDPNNL